MKKNTNTIIAEAKKLSSKMPKTINESLNFNGMPREDDDMEMDGDEPIHDKPIEPKPQISDDGGIDIDNYINNMRKSSLKIMAKLSDNPDSSVYLFAKKIFQLADKAHEDEKEGKDINGQPKQPQQQNNI